MRAIVQRVRHASVTVAGQIVGQIGLGLVILLGVSRGDTETDAEFLVDRVLGLRVFADSAGKMNLALRAVGGELLIISQFTLHADTSQRRPSFTDAGAPDEARRLYEYFLSRVRQSNVNVEAGQFGRHMELSLLNDGPVTIILDSRNR